MEKFEDDITKVEFEVGIHNQFTASHNLATADQQEADIDSKWDIFKKAVVDIAK